MNTKQRVLFLCTDNSARSQMAEAFLRLYGGDQFEAYSAGLEPNGIHPLTDIVMQEIGISMAEHPSKGVNTYFGKMLFKYLITVCDKAEQKCPTMWPGINQRLHWSFEDPAIFQGTDDEKIEKFREIRNQIGLKVRQWLTEMVRPVR